ncbi:MAG: cytochrome c-type biogenesis protein [Geminicoccaceae bacterium]
MRLLALVILLLAGPALAATAPDEMLKDPVLEARARTIGQELRCLVCQNQSIDESDADLAHDLRRLVRERLVAGDSDQAVLDYVHARYGDFVLLRPPVEPVTWLLWFGPAALLLLGGGLILAFYRGRRGAEAAPELDAAERARLERLMSGEGGR